MNVLIVTNPFDGRDIGSRITDPQEIEAVLAGEHAPHVLRADHECEPAPAPAAHETETHDAGEA